MLRRVYDNVIALAERPSAPLWLLGLAFAEASFFPLPPDVLLIPMALANPRRAPLFAALATLGSVAGGALGYLIGYALFAKLAQPLIHFYHYDAAFAAFQHKFAEYGVAVILIKGLTPIPYKIVTIAAGAAAFSFPLFMGASLITRGGRFFLEALLLRIFGEPARHFIEDRLGLVTATIAVLILAGFIALKLA
ncbi:VTT domain-containing protein [Acidocella aromatica]|uniref:Membrane protein YqaA with SNARE-associated domain n=1 Tax=Acidocella aromatica TaxID=1303579 RepID=A0A840VMT4_9PROT|nr:membrane protein YqaA with SNARE-associated domain [Acidocella aromatica]